MLAERIEPNASAPLTQKSTFFRQSGWLMIANIAGGALMWAVHLLANKIGTSQYGLFVTLLTAVMLVPAIPMQMVFAQQAARAVARGAEAELAGLIRFICGATLAVWLLICLAVFILQSQILAFWGVTPAALWTTMPTLLLAIWAPIFMGVLQGEQNFLWLGLSMIGCAVGRLGGAAIAVLGLHLGATGMMIGVLAGAFVGLLPAMCQTHRIWWALAPRAFAWGGVLRQIIPLLFGFIFVQFLFTGDTLFVKHYFSEDATGAYGSAGTLSRALIWLVGPLATVMFPRIVHSSAKSEQTNILGMVLLGTAILSVGGAVGLAVLGRFVIVLLWGSKFVAAGAVLPWYAAAMVPLALANVLVNNLLARSQFKVVPVTFLLSLAYAATMVYVNQTVHTLPAVLQTLGVFNLLFLAVCSWFTWGAKQPAAR